MFNITLKNLYQCFSNFNCSAIPPSINHLDHTTNSPTSPLIKNFNSLYTLTSSSDFFSSSSTTSSSSSHPHSSPPPDLATAFASQRFFVSSPGPSNSILHSPPPPSSSSSSHLLSGSAAAIPTYSADPYADFRRSMEEMVEARGLTDVKGEWDFLNELLLCYLSLNPKNTHHIIFSAFSDLIVSLMALDSYQKIDDGGRRLV